MVGFSIVERNMPIWQAGICNCICDRMSASWTLQREILLSEQAHPDSQTRWTILAPTRSTKVSEMLSKSKKISTDRQNSSEKDEKNITQERMKSRRKA